jgi:hypothetical protein
MNDQLGGIAVASTHPLSRWHAPMLRLRLSQKLDHQARWRHDTEFLWSPAPKRAGTNSGDHWREPKAGIGNGAADYDAFAAARQFYNPFPPVQALRMVGLQSLLGTARSFSRISSVAAILGPR